MVVRKRGKPGERVPGHGNKLDGNSFSFSFKPSVDLGTLLALKAYHFLCEAEKETRDKGLRRGIEEAKKRLMEAILGVRNNE